MRSILDEITSCRDMLQSLSVRTDASWKQGATASTAEMPVLHVPVCLLPRGSPGCRPCARELVGNFLGNSLGTRLYSRVGRGVCPDRTGGKRLFLLTQRLRLGRSALPVQLL